MKKIVLFVCSSIYLTGCASNVKEVAKAEATPNPIYAQQLLLEIAKSAKIIAQSAQEQRMIDAALRMPDLTENQYRNFMKAQQNTPPEFNDRVTMPPYSGPPEKIIMSLASQMNWGFVVEGNEPPVPEIIDKTYRDVPINEVIRDISYSIDTADILIDNKTKKIIYRYKG